MLGGICPKPIFLQVFLPFGDPEELSWYDSMSILLHRTDGTIAIPCDQIFWRFKVEPMHELFRVLHKPVSKSVSLCVSMGRTVLFRSGKRPCDVYGP